MNFIFVINYHDSLKIIVTLQLQTTFSKLYDDLRKTENDQISKANRIRKLIFSEPN